MNSANVSTLVCCIALAFAIWWPAVREPLRSNSWLLMLLVHLGSKAQVASFIAYNATIWTNTGAPMAQALAVRNGRIAAIGTNQDVLALQTPDTVIQNLNGSFIMPGLIDAHIHLVSGGQTLSWVDLSKVNSRQQFAAAVKSVADTARANKWVMGHGWEEAHWDGELPTAAWIDDVSPHNPVLLYRMDIHMVLLNTIALKMTGINSLTEAPEGGRIQHGGDGEPTGILVDKAIGLATAHVPSLSHADKKKALEAATAHILSKGITTVCDMGAMGNPADTWDTLENIYMPAADTGQLSLRVFAMVPLPSWRRMEKLVNERGKAHSGGFLHWGGLKDFADGSLGSRTALMQEPYADDPSTSGIRLSPYTELQQLVQDADATGLQIAIHAIGDQALEDVLAWYDAARKHTSILSGSKATASIRRHRIEHAQHLLGSGTGAALSRQQTVAVVNPLHLLSDMHIMEQRLGRSRIGPDRAFAYKDMLKGGGSVAFASDWPVVAIEPLLGMYTAVNRRSPDMPASRAWFPNGAVSVEEALHAHTAGAAFACGLENEVGSLKLGMKADFAVLSGNLLHVFEDPERQLPDVKAVYIDGVCKHGC